MPENIVPATQRALKHATVAPTWKGRTEKKIKEHAISPKNEFALLLQI